MANYNHGPTKDLTGEKFGRLTVLSYAGSSRWLCRCECGAVKKIQTYDLNSRQTTSCGCYRKDYMKDKATKHGGSEEALYHVLNMMHQRCENPRCKDYKWYGAEGKKVCVEWSLANYPAFRDWAISAGYKPGLTIDRIDPEKDYCPDNCRWITIEEQQQNRRDTKK